MGANMAAILKPDLTLYIYSAFGKCSDPLTFHILLGYSLILKLIKLFYPSSIYTQYPIMIKHFFLCKFIYILKKNGNITFT